MSASRGWAAPAAALLLLAALLAALPSPVASNLGGTFDARERGCYCHSSGPNEAVGFTVAGLPGRYAPDTNYTVVITVTYTDVPAEVNKSQGGFYFEATGGTVGVPAGMEGLVQVQGLEATHTANGSKARHWSVNWTSPHDPGLVITFYVFVNTVNGNKSETFGTDHWTQKTVRISVGDEPEVTGPGGPRPPFAMETYAMLAIGGAFAAYAFYLFYTVRKPASPGAPDNRQGKVRRKGPGKD